MYENGILDRMSYASACVGPIFAWPQHLLVGHPRTLTKGMC